MGLPDHAVELKGGCDCGAIRYKISIPPVEGRPLSLSKPGPTFDSPPPHIAKAPHIAVCFCNSCRAASSSFAPAYIGNPAYMVTVSCLPQADEPSDVSLEGVKRLVERDQVRSDEGRPPFVPAVEVMRPGAPGARGTWVRFYRGAGCNGFASRSFCGRCGTSVGYHFNMFAATNPRITRADGWEDIMDICLGTVDREDLEKPYMQPERWYNWPTALPWIQELFKDAPGPRHPSFFTEDVLE